MEILFREYSFKIKCITRSLIIFKKPRKITNDFFNHDIFVRTFQWTSSEWSGIISHLSRFLQKYLTVKNHYLLTRKSSVIASEGFLISVWSLLFHHSLLKEPLEVDFKWNPLKWDFFQEFWSALKCFFSRILSGGQKVFYVYVKNEKNTLSDLSHVVRKSFSANESYHYFSFILKI